MALLEHQGDVHQSRYKRAVSIGIVSDRRLSPTHGGPEVRVTMEDTGKTTAWLPIEQEGTYGKQHFFCPRKGERVKINRLSTGLEVGTAGKSIYCNTVKAPSVAGLDVDFVKYDDGSFFYFDPGAKKWVINTQGECDLTTVGPIKVVSTGDVNVTTQGALNAIVTGTATVQAPNIVLKGNVAITGTLTVSGNVTVNGTTTTVQNLNIIGTETGGGSV